METCKTHRYCNRNGSTEIVGSSQAEPPDDPIVIGTGRAQVHPLYAGRNAESSEWMARIPIINKRSQEAHEYVTAEKGVAQLEVDCYINLFIRVAHGPRPKSPTCVVPKYVGLPPTEYASCSRGHGLFSFSFVIYLGYRFSQALRMIVMPCCCCWEN